MKNKKNIIRIFAGIAAVMVFYFGYEHFTYIETDDAYVQAHVVMLAPRVPGTVVKVSVDENQEVKQGQILAQIDDRDYVNAQAQSEADVISLDAREHEFKLNYERSTELYKRKAVTKQQFDDSQAAFTEMSQRLKSAKARLDQAKLNLSYTRVVAPSDGSIAKKSVEEGQLLAPGQPVFGFVSAKERWVTANFKETDLARIKIGQSASVSVDALSGGDYTGEVESISSSTGATFTLLPADNSSGNFTKVVQRVPVRIKFGKLSAEDLVRLKAGLSAVVSVRIR